MQRQSRGGLSNDDYADHMLGRMPAADLHQDGEGGPAGPAQGAPELDNATVAILSGLERIHAALIDGRPEGIEVKRVLSVTATPQLVELDVVSYTLFNDGANAVFTSASGPQMVTNSSFNPPLNSGDADAITFGRRTKVVFWIACATGETATVRIRGMS